MTDPAVGLADAIRSLRAELSQAMQEGAEEELQFRVGEVDLEFQVQVTGTGGGGVGVRFWVLSAEAKADRARAVTHRIALTLTPVRRGSDEDVRVGDRTRERTDGWSKLKSGRSRQSSPE